MFGKYACIKKCKLSIECDAPESQIFRKTKLNVLLTCHFNTKNITVILVSAEAFSRLQLLLRSILVGPGRKENYYPRNEDGKPRWSRGKRV